MVLEFLIGLLNRPDFNTEFLWKDMKDEISQVECTDSVELLDD